MPLIINQILHIFGWALVFQISGDKIIVYPARVKFRGFDFEHTSENYLKVTNYMNENASELLKEIQDEQIDVI